LKNLSLLAISVKSALFAGAISSFAAVAADENENEAEEEEIEKVVVTGSRIRKAEFSNASPIQIISGDLSREMGMFEAGEMLQSTNQASGVQIDNTFGGYVLDNGPGAATVGFRGLGAERTLVLINGRRMAPAGVGGAPTSPDLNLIPGVMIDRVENLFDGASTVYGSDAVAGVANVILKSDIEGFQIEGSYQQPKGEGGEQTNLSAMYGYTYDNGFITVGAEYSDSKAQSYSGSAFLKGCEERIYESEDGDIVTRFGGIGPTINGENTCDIFPLTNRAQIPTFWGSVYYTPGFTNTGVPNFSETTVSSSLEGYLPSWIAADFNGDGIIDDLDGVIVDGNGDGLRDVDFQDPFYAFQQSDYYKSGDYRSRNERISVMANGEHNFADDNDTTLYYEGLYAQRETPIFGPGAQIFQWVPASNPYNPCGVNGIDCFEMLGAGPAGPQDMRPIINIRGDRDRTEVKVSQYRLVTGVTGNLPGLESINLDNRYKDVYASYSASKGTDERQGINEERLVYSLDTSVLNNDGTVTCGDGTDGCVPVNLFSDNLFQTGGGNLSAEEAAYLFMPRTMETKVNQFVVNGFLGGDLYTLPWNNETITGVFGAEYRRDEIKSNPNAAAADGLLWGYFADQGADGDRSLREVFTEIDMPLVKGVTGIEEFTLTLSGRVSDESFYDPESTYSVKAVYRPVEWVTLRGTQGTSYRAPNLRERFLNGTTGFNTIGDPCVVPGDARAGDPLDPNSPASYDPAGDNRDQATLDRCSADGVDPTSLGLGQNGTQEFTGSYSAEIVTGGTTELNPETSVATTYGFILEQPFIEDMDLTFSLTRFDIEVTNSIAEPSAGYSIGQCYAADGIDAFCGRINRDENGQIDLVDASFINIGLLTSQGYDYNIYYNQDFVISEQNFGVTLDIQATKMTESLYDVLGTVDDNVGEPDVPEWRGTARLSLEYSDFRFNWLARYISAGEEDELGEFEEDTTGCTGLFNSQGGRLKCRPVGYTEDYWKHDMGVTYSADDFLISAGIRNVFNEAPPKVDPSGSFSSTNVPLGVGYDTFGRMPYINFSVNF
jgi:iron complex outermembrane receptor protein